MAGKMEREATWAVIAIQQYRARMASTVDDMVFFVARSRLAFTLALGLIYKR
jgi:hypothetical protein